MLTHKQTLIIAATLGCFGVALGAFGAHALKPSLLASGRLDTFELAVRYQFYHALALFFVGFWMEKNYSAPFRWAASLLFSGVLLFSGSLYLLALTEITTFAFITPLGGLLMLLGWICLVYGFVKQPAKKAN
jgi:uncharacterized membrane protein YgdD (TMEM256/DUF423 family)